MARRVHGATRLQREPKPEGRGVAVVVKLLLSALLLGAVVWGGQQLLDPARFPLHTVRIESPLQRVAQQTIRDTVGRYVQAGFLGVDVDAVRDALEALPWVQRATVRRAWPDKLVVRVTEQQALARWGNEALVNMRGELFRPQLDESWGRLPLLRGPRDSNRQVAEQYVAMQGMLKPLGLTITHLSLDERRALSLRLDNGLQLGLGRQDTDLRLLRFVRVFPRVLKPRLAMIESIDLRYTNGLAVRWRAGHAPAAA
ncbi:MAG: cell division protein FtsQ/DivIB [Gammaproteobacteria bacterium]|nr:cell division protein FtsQ/DivIB [Gammaproteobacteria bacterium]